MGCTSCSTRTADGKAAGCKSNGNCGTSGCNRMNVYDWLADLPMFDGFKPYPVIEVSFKRGSRKDFYRNSTDLILEKGDCIAVEGTNGFDVGEVSLTGELVKLQMKKRHVDDSPDLKKVLRLASDSDLEVLAYNAAREQDVMVRARVMARLHALEMKIAEVEVQADGKKVTIYYTADHRIDFREIIRLYATEFRARVEMRQIGARQESGKVGGIGSCGRELCCSTWLTDFKAVNTTAARYQNLSINQTKLAGQCGRLKCCLNYELDTYMDALKGFPGNADKLDMAKGWAYLQKKDIFRNLMWYTLPGSSRQYPLTIERVNEILALNKEGVRPEDLGAVELEKPTDKDGVAESAFVNDVGELSLRALERKDKKSKKSRNKSAGKPEGADRKPPAEGGAAPRPPREERRPRREGAAGSSNRPPREEPRPRREEGSNAPKPQRAEGAATGAPPAGPRPERRSRNRPPRPRGEGGAPKPPVAE